MLAITVLWLGCVFVSNPAGAFPLNDDWAYALSVKHLLETGEFHPIDWTQALHLSHAAWGYLFVWLGGWSDELLRASTLVLSLVGVLAMYQLSRLLRASRVLAVVAALMLAFNPIYYSLSFTYMTDVPFAALLILAALGFAHSLLRKSDAWLAIAVFAALAATLNRQIGLALPIAYAVAHIMRFGIGIASIFRAVTPLLICTGALVGVEQWMAATGRTPVLYNESSEGLLNALRDPRRLKFAVLITFAASVYLGLFVLPLSALLAARMISAVNSSGRMVALGYLMLGALTAALGIIGLVKFGPLPWIGNIIDAAGIGPHTLRDTYVLRLGSVAPLPATFWFAATICGVLGATLLVGFSLAVIGMLKAAWRDRKIQPLDAAGVFLLMSAFICFVPVAFHSAFDRYLVPQVPLLAGGMIAFFSTRGQDPTGLRISSMLVSLSALAAMLVYSVAGTHDYLAWNRARWSLIDELLVHQHVHPRSIDGGYEFNGRYTYAPDYVKTKTKSWWWVNDDTYVLAFGPIPGYMAVRQANFDRWLHLSQSTVTLLKRETPYPADPVHSEPRP
jgi:4-amino-4-deoxy-L-arabinose transferase-like glycosyltransferase